MDMNKKANFPRIPWFLPNRPGLYSLGPNVMIVLLYDMKLRRNSFRLIELLPCILFFSMYFQVSTQKPKQTYKFCNGTPTSINDVAKTFSAMKILVIGKN